MRTPDAAELREEAGLATKLEDEASAWRKRRLARPKISMESRWYIFRGAGYGAEPSRRPSAVLKCRFHFPCGPTFTCAYDPNHAAGADKRMRADVVLRRDDVELGLRFPVERDVEIARKNLPARAVVEYDDVALGMRSDLHGIVTLEGHVIPREPPLPPRIEWFTFDRTALGRWPCSDPACSPRDGRSRSRWLRPACHGPPCGRQRRQRWLP
jgi:hypothetical protein